MYKVIYHIDEREKWSLTLGNVTNMIVYYQVHHIDYQIEVLANSVAVCDYLKGSTFQSQILSLIEKKVIFVACHNAMEAHHILAEQLMENIQVVDAGVVELVTKQSEGFAYIKP